MNLRSIQYFVARNGTLFGAILLALFFYYWNANFLSFANMRNIGEALSALGVVAIPLAMLVIAGAIDLSVGSVASLSGVVAATVMVSTGSVMLGIAAGLLVGVVTGALNGLLVSYFKFNPIVITLGAMSVWGGMALQLTGGRTISGLPEAFTGLSLIRIGGIPMEIFVLGAAVVYGIVVLGYLPYGRRLRAIGGSNRAAFLMGVPVERVQFWMFVQVGVAASLAGVMLASKLAAATPITGQGLELNALTVVLLGGVAFAGGVGRMSGVLAGLLFVGVLRNGLIFMNTSQFLQQVLVGLTLIVAIVFDETVSKFARGKWEGKSTGDEMPGQSGAVDQAKQRS
jgi:ribose/xylose/arabinose/galactoside ABC-type transport system permease subunit